MTTPSAPGAKLAMKRPTLVLGDDMPDQRGVSAIPPSHTKVADKKSAGSPAEEGAPASASPASASPAQGDARVQAALAASTRTEASLSQLMRAVQSLSAGVSGAREANVQLVRELEKLRDMLAAANQHQLTSKNRLVALEKALEQSHEASARERVFLTEQHDSFISSLIEDHERVVSALSSELEAARKLASRSPEAHVETSGVRANAGLSEAQLREQLVASQRNIEKLVGERERSRETLLRLQTQRDEAQSSVVKLTRERDQARAELTQLKIQQGMSDAMREAHGRSGSVPPSSAAPSKPASSPTASARPVTASTRPAPSSGAARPLAAAAPTSRPPLANLPPAAASVPRPTASPSFHPSARSTAPVPVNTPSNRPTVPPHHSPPPAELAAAITVPVKGAAGAPMSEAPVSPLRPKPDPSTRPLVGYSLTDSGEERVDTSRITNPTRPTTK